MSDAARRAKKRRAKLSTPMLSGKKLHNPSNGSDISKRRAIETRTKFKSEANTKHKVDATCTKDKPCNTCK